MKYSEMSDDEKLLELNRRAAEMVKDPSACIPNEKVNELLRARMCRDASNASA